MGEAETAALREALRQIAEYKPHSPMWAWTVEYLQRLAAKALAATEAVREPAVREAQPADYWHALAVERLAVVAAARRFLAAHDVVIAATFVSSRDTFAMKNRADVLRDVLALYDENAARLAPRSTNKPEGGTDGRG